MYPHLLGNFQSSLPCSAFVSPLMFVPLFHPKFWASIIWPLFLFLYVLALHECIAFLHHWFSHLFQCVLFPCHPLFFFRASTNSPTLVLWVSSLVLPLSLLFGSLYFSWSCKRSHLFIVWLYYVKTQTYCSWSVNYMPWMVQSYNWFPPYTYFISLVLWSILSRNNVC